MAALTDARFQDELARCLACEDKPCRGGCPAGVSPADFIQAALRGGAEGLERAAALILGPNPLGAVCGAVCPDSLCMARCTRGERDAPVDIPGLQAAVVARAGALGLLPRPAPAAATGERVAVVGAGPAGLGAAAVLARAGHEVHLLERARRPGGMLRLVPAWRLDPAVLDAELAWLLGQGDVRLVPGRPVARPRDLLARGFGAVVVAAGLGVPLPLEVPGAARALPWTALLGPRPRSLRGRRVAVVGDGAVALDCAEAARARGAAHVELFARKALGELAQTRRERDRLLAAGVEVSGRVRVTAVLGRGPRVAGLALRRLALPPGQAFHPSRLADVPRSDHERRDLDAVVLALGGRAGLERDPHPRIHHAGDQVEGPTTVVQALASGKRAAQAVHQALGGADAACPDRISCGDGSGCPRRATCPEKGPVPAA